MSLLRGSRTLAFSLSAVAAAVAVVGTAPAANALYPTYRYASPHGSGTDCSQTQPCSFSTAVMDAQGDGQIVELAPGTYGSASHPMSYVYNRTYQLTVEGTPGRAMPTLYMTGSGSAQLSLELTKSTLRRVVLRIAGGYEGVIANELDHVYAISSATYDTCFAWTAVRDSVCIATARGARALVEGSNGAGPYTATFTVSGSTLVGTGPLTEGLEVSSSQYCTCEVDVTDSIMQGPAGDIVESGTGTASVDVEMSNSSYVTAPSNGAATFTENGGDIHRHARFRNLASGDLRERPGSPTIDAGVSESGDPRDLGGNPRKLGAAQDMGAYEFIPPPSVGRLAPHSARHSITVTTRVNPRGVRARVQMVATAAGHAGRTRWSTIGSAARSVTLRISGLAAATRYRVSVVARSAGGTTAVVRRIRTTG